MKKTKPKLLLDSHKGVYFAYVTREEKQSNGQLTCHVKNMRQCFYWGVAQQGAKGVYGLAIIGPTVNSKIGPSVNGKILDIIKIIDCTKEAEEKWLNATW